MGRKSFFAVGIVLLLFSLSTCKEPEDIGLNTLPSGDLLYTDFSEAATILSTTIREDTLRGDELSRILFGSISDSTSGLTNSNYFGQILLSSTPNLIADSTQSYGADSLVLSLAYSGWYGDTTVPQNIHVYRLTEDMYVDSAYYSNKTFLTDLVDIEGTQAPYSIKPTSTVVVGTDTNSAPQLRIRLNDSLRDSIFAKNSQSEFASNENWKSYFKGVHVTVNQVQGHGGALLYFSPTSPYTKMTLYYHEGTESKSYSFTMYGGARLHNATHDYTGSSVQTQLDNPGTQYELNYLKPMAGLKTMLSFPDLKNFTDSGSILINKAELVITVLTDTLTSSTKPVPGSILMLAKNAGGEYEFPIDYFERSYGGSYNSATQTYTFGITRTIQRILTGTITDYGYSLNILGSMIAGNGATIGGGKTGASQMKLRLYYTKLH